MSKKDKSKFKKQLKAKILEDMAKTQGPNPTLNKPVETTNTATVPQNINIGSAQATTISENPDINLDQIKHDLKKTGIVVACLAIIIGLLYYLDLKYGVLLHFGNWLFKVLNIS